MTHVHANSRESITKAKHSIMIAVCPALYSAFQPHATQAGDAYKWDGTGQYKCVRWGI